MVLIPTPATTACSRQGGEDLQDYEGWGLTVDLVVQS